MRFAFLKPPALINYRQKGRVIGENRTSLYEKVGGGGEGGLNPGLLYGGLKQIRKKGKVDFVAEQS